MKLYVKSDQESLDFLLDKEIDGVILGVHPYAQRMRNTYTFNDLKPLIDKVKAAKKEVWLTMNAIIHEADIEALEYIFKQIKDLPIDGLMFADLAIAKLAKTHGLLNKLVYDSETYLTNSEDVSFWQAQGIKAVVGARQLTIEDIEIINNKSSMPFAMQLHGYVNMFHSARPLIETFFRHTGDVSPEKHNENYLKLVEHQRREEPYPIYQDAFGTHVFRSKPMHAFNDFERVKNHVDYFIVNTILYDAPRVASIVDDLIKANKEGVNDALLKKYIDHDEGFLHKKTVYNEGGGNR
jgi:putative protease